MEISHKKGLYDTVKSTGEKFVDYDILNDEIIGPYTCKQLDSYNCGPIACVAVWCFFLSDNERLYFRLASTIKSFADQDLRSNQSSIHKMTAMASSQYIGLNVDGKQIESSDNFIFTIAQTKSNEDIKGKKNRRWMVKFLQRTEQTIRKDVGAKSNVEVNVDVRRKTSNAITSVHVKDTVTMAYVTRLT